MHAILLQINAKHLKGIPFAINKDSIFGQIVDVDQIMNATDVLP